MVTSVLLGYVSGIHCFKIISPMHPLQSKTESVELNEEPFSLMSSFNQLLRTEIHTKLAILELSSRACKLLLVRANLLRNGFTWSAFENESTLTNTGLLLDERNHLEWSHFEKQVLPTLENYINSSKLFGASALFCVATASLRQAINKDEIVQKLEQTLGIHIQILTQQEEAKATVKAYYWSIGHKTHQPTLLIDQGGSSTELSIFDESLQSIPLSQVSHIQSGTNSAIRSLLKSKPPEQNFAIHLKDEAQNVGFNVLQALNGLVSNSVQHLIGVGSAITDATGRESNRLQHLCTLTRQEIQTQYDDAFHYLTTHPKYTTLNEFKLFYKNSVSTSEHYRTHKMLVRYFGLGMVLQLMRKLDFPTLTVNGVGLRYGICYHALQNLCPNHFVDSQVSPQTTGLSLFEGLVLTGTVSNVDTRFGVFVVLDEQHTGLVHKSAFNGNYSAMRSLSKGDPIDVRILKIKRGKSLRFVLKLV